MRPSILGCMPGPAVATCMSASAAHLGLMLDSCTADANHTLVSSGKTESSYSKSCACQMAEISNCHKCLPAFRTFPGTMLAGCEEAALQYGMASLRFGISIIMHIMVLAKKSL